MNKILLVLMMTIFITGCATDKPNSSIVEGRLIGTRNVNGQLFCVYGAMGSGNAGTFTGVPPREIGGCTNNAKINLRNNDITWLVQPSRNHVKYIN
ncbi:TPA: hypothetical protein OMS07_002487 [Klebsiella aerogenes]|nr:hypothetical protein [Klebsiella aerogenes]